MVINADDYYGPDAFMKIYDFLSKSQEETAGGHGSSVGAAKPGDSEFRGRENEGRAENEYTFAMVGYKLSNTLTENGHVSRGICEVSSDGYLANIRSEEHTSELQSRTYLVCRLLLEKKN